MASKPTIRLDSKGVSRAVAQVVTPQLEAAAKRVAGGVVGASTGVEMDKDRNGDPVARVAITEPHGLAIQARTGALTRAAAAQGMDIHRYPGAT